MPTVSPVRFDTAWSEAAKFVETRFKGLVSRLVVLRDIHGRVRVAIDDRSDVSGLPDEESRKALAAELHRSLGAFSPGPIGTLLFASEMFVPEDIFDAPDILEEPFPWRVLERNIVGSDWLRPPFERTNDIPRLALYGIKGGVGRSTASAVLAWRLCEAGKRVLVIDLDLESPGVGTTLLAPERAPDFGVVDWLVEDMVRQANDVLLGEMAGLSPLGQKGELVVVPSSGRPREGYTYLPKLARAYAEAAGRDSEGGTSEGVESFGSRLHRLVNALEQAQRPDLTILDSRAGLHDIAGVVATRLDATVLLFAVDSTQTWFAYRSLFEAWRQHPERAQAFRHKLKMVAAMVPDTETLRYLSDFTSQSHALFENNLYVETAPGEESDFNYAFNDPDAPHVPLRIHWSRGLQQFDPVAHPESVTEEQLRAGFGDFVKGTASLLLGEELW